MRTPIPPQHPPGTRPISRAGNHEYPGHPSRNPVSKVIEPSRGPPKVLITRIPIADHRVQRVHSPISKQPRHPRNSPPHQRSNRGVRRILRHRLGSGPRQGVSVQPSRITSAQMRQPRPRSVQLPRFKRLGHQPPLTPQRSAPKHSPRGKRRNPNPGNRPPNSPLSSPPQSPNATHQQSRENNPTPPRVGINTTLQRPSNPPKSSHRMPPTRISEDNIQGNTEQQPSGPAVSRGAHRARPSAVRASPEHAGYGARLPRARCGPTRPPAAQHATASPCKSDRTGPGPPEGPHAERHDPARRRRRTTASAAQRRPRTGARHDRPDQR